MTGRFGFLPLDTGRHGVGQMPPHPLPLALQHQHPRQLPLALTCLRLLLARTRLSRLRHRLRRVLLQDVPVVRTLCLCYSSFYPHTRITCMCPQGRGQDAGSNWMTNTCMENGEEFKLGFIPMTWRSRRWTRARAVHGAVHPQSALRRQEQRRDPRVPVQHAQRPPRASAKEAKSTSAISSSSAAKSDADGGGEILSFYHITLKKPPRISESAARGGGKNRHILN